MAKAFVVLTVLFALAAASADARLLHRLERGRSLAAGATEVDPVSICDHATFPKLCRALIPSLPHPITSASLTEAAIQQTVTKCEEAKAAASRNIADPKATQKVKETLSVCYLSFQKALERLGEAAMLLNQPDTHDKVMVQLQNAVAYVGSCEDAFDEFPGEVNPISNISGHLEKLTSNSLSLALGAVDY